MGIEIAPEGHYTLLSADDQPAIPNVKYDPSFMTRKLMYECTKWGLEISLHKTEHLANVKKSIYGIIEQHRLMWYGQIHRMSEDSLG